MTPKTTPNKTNKKNKGKKAKAEKQAKQAKKELDKARTEQEKARASLNVWEIHHDLVWKELLELLKQEEKPNPSVSQMHWKRTIDDAKALGLEDPNKWECLDSKKKEGDHLAWMISNRQKELERCVAAKRKNEKILKFWEGEEMVLDGTIDGPNPNERPDDLSIEEWSLEVPVVRM